MRLQHVLLLDPVPGLQQMLGGVKNPWTRGKKPLERNVRYRFMKGKKKFRECFSLRIARLDFAAMLQYLRTCCTPATLGVGLDFARSETD